MANVVHLSSRCGDQTNPGTTTTVIKITLIIIQSQRTMTEVVFQEDQRIQELGGFGFGESGLTQKEGPSDSHVWVSPSLFIPMSYDLLPGKKDWLKQVVAVIKTKLVTSALPFVQDRK